jgi:hypothetical protein
MLCARATGAPMTLSLLDTRMRAMHVHDRAEEWRSRDLDFLRELELIRLAGDGDTARYEITVPLMAEWIEKNIDPEDIRRKAATGQPD